MLMKFYSLLLMALALILPSMASAKSVTFKTNLDKSAYITFAPSYEYLDVTVEGITVDLAADAGVNVSANEGYVIFGDARRRCYHHHHQGKTSALA